MTPHPGRRSSPSGPVAAADAEIRRGGEGHEPPKDLGDAVRAVLDNKAMSVTDDKGKELCTVWAVKSLETKATADQAKAGLKYAPPRRDHVGRGGPIPGHVRRLPQAEDQAGGVHAAARVPAGGRGPPGDGPVQRVLPALPGRPGQEAGRPWSRRNCTS